MATHDVTVELERGGRPWGAFVRDHAMEVSGAVALVAVLALFSVLRPDVFPTSANLSVVLSNTSVAGVLAIGLSVSLVAGQFDLSIGAVLAITGVLVASLLNHGVPWPIAVLAAIALGAGIGLVSGLLTVRGEVLSIVATLAMRYTTAGRNLQAVGRNPEAARLAGLNVGGYVLASLMVTSAFAGVAGVLLAAHLGGGHPEVGPGYVLPAFAAAFFGAAAHRTGTFTFLGGLYGAFLLTSVTNGLVIANAADWTANVVTGLVLLGAV